MPTWLQDGLRLQRKEKIKGRRERLQRNMSCSRLCVACIRYTLGRAQTYMFLAKCCMHTLHTRSTLIPKLPIMLKFPSP